MDPFHFELNNMALFHGLDWDGGGEIFGPKPLEASHALAPPPLPSSTYSSHLLLHHAGPCPLPPLSAAYRG